MNDEQIQEKLMKEYIGNDAEKIMNSNLNWSAAIIGQFIGPVWFFYRKSYLLGFAFLAITVIVECIAIIVGLLPIFFIMFFIYLFTTNKLYLWNVKRKVNSMILNSNLSGDELVSYVRNKGGTSIVAPVIYVVIEFVCMNLIIGYIMYCILSFGLDFIKSFSENPIW